jgi:hypothetical protein
MSRADSPLRDKVIFVVGSRRSGTNWLQRVLDAHPDVVAVPSETFLFAVGLRPLRDRFHQGALTSTITGFVHAGREPMLDAMRDLCDVVFEGLMRGIDPAATRIVERTPDHVRHLDLVGEIYPDAHVVHIVRDGRDVVRSLLSHDWAPDDAREATLEWRSAIESARDNAPRLEHYHEVSYERMLTNQEREITALFDALGLSTAPADLDPVFAEVGVRYNADPSSPAIEVAKWRTGLAPEILAVVEEVAGDVLDELGYERSDVTPAAAPKPVATKPRLVRSLRSRLPRRTRRSSARHRLEQSHYKLDLFLDAATSSFPERIRAVIAPALRVRIINGDDRFEARGDAAVERLIHEFRTDPAMRGRQVVGHIHPTTTSITFIGEFEVEGRRHPRVLVLILRNDLVERVAYYRFPPG